MGGENGGDIWFWGLRSKKKKKNQKKKNLSNQQCRKGGQSCDLWWWSRQWRWWIIVYNNEKSCISVQLCNVLNVVQTIKTDVMTLLIIDVNKVKHFHVKKKKKKKKPFVFNYFACIGSLGTQSYIVRGTHETTDNSTYITVVVVVFVFFFFQILRVYYNYQSLITMPWTSEEKYFASLLFGHKII